MHKTHFFHTKQLADDTKESLSQFLILKKEQLSAGLLFVEKVQWQQHTRGIQPSGHVHSGARLARLPAGMRYVTNASTVFPAHRSCARSTSPFRIPLYMHFPLMHCIIMLTISFICAFEKINNRLPYFIVQYLVSTYNT